MYRNLIVLSTLICGLLLGSSAFPQDLGKRPSSPNVAVDKSPLTRSTGTITSFAPIVDAIAPSVVSVYTSKTVKVPRELRQNFGGVKSGELHGLGSGVIVSDDGFILTNNHVTDGADEILVSIGLDRKEYKAKKIGTDPATDLAVLKIDAKNLPAITFADSDKVRVGDIVLAVGNPYGLTQTVTMGIISGVGRSGMGITDYEDFIQTDASINPGNSGGALVDTEGRLVGINTAIFSPNGGNNGIGFAIPANLAHEVMKAIREHGSVVRGYLGAIVQPVTQDLADSFKIKDVAGALVSDVNPSGPAEKAGIKAGDVIIEINDNKIQDARSLRLLVSNLAPGTKANVHFIRDSKEQSALVELGTMPKSEGESSSDDPSSTYNRNVLDGLAVSDLDKDIREMFHIPNNVEGVVVSGVVPDSACYHAGLREGVVIEEINHQRVSNGAEATEIGQQVKKDDKVLLRVWNRGHNEYITISGR